MNRVILTVVGFCLFDSTKSTFPPPQVGILKPIPVTAKHIEPFSKIVCTFLLQNLLRTADVLSADQHIPFLHVTLSPCSQTSIIGASPEPA
jgi:hypothetical protein